MYFRLNKLVVWIWRLKFQQKFFGQFKRSYVIVSLNNTIQTTTSSYSNLDVRLLEFWTYSYKLKPLTCNNSLKSQNLFYPVKADKMETTFKHSISFECMNIIFFLNLQFKECMQMQFGAAAFRSFSTFQNAKNSMRFTNTAPRYIVQHCQSER